MAGKRIAHYVGAQPGGDDPLNTLKSPTRNEQDVFGVHLYHFLFGMLTSALRWHINHGAFEQLQQSLLYSFARNIAGNGRVVAFAGDFVDFVNENNPFFGGFYIVIGGLQQAGEDTFHIFAHVTGFGEHGGVGNGKRHMQHTGNGTGQQGLPGTGIAHQNDVGFFDFHIIFVFRLADAFVVVVNRHRKHFFGIFLANNVLVEKGFDFGWFQQSMVDFDVGMARGHLFIEDGFGLFDAVIADFGFQTGYQQLGLRLGPAAKRAMFFF